MVSTQATEEFESFIHSRLKPGCYGALHEVHSTPFYLPDPAREEFFQDDGRVRRILDAVLEPEDRHLVRLETLRNDYSKVFLTLLSIRRGWAIAHLITQPRFSDSHLPFENRDSFPSPLSDDAFFDEFYKKQWMFCAPTLTYRHWYEWEPERILPVEYKALGRGGSAKTFLMRVHPAHNALHCSKVYRQNSHCRSNMIPANLVQDGEEPCHQFVVKAFRPREFDQSAVHEMQLFAVTQHKHNNTVDDCIISFYGSYKHGETFHIILEHADKGTLEDYLQTIPRPSNSHDIYVFWNNFLKLLNALNILHNVGRENQEGYFCHHDIKPQNILVSSRKKGSDYDCRFILSDFGECRFRAQMGIGRAPTGTMTYGAPELFDPDPRATMPILQSGPEADIWSLGCVLSEVASWIGSGTTGLNYYRDMRRLDHNWGSIRALENSDCFHDGVKVLQSVTKHHNDIIPDKLLKGDSITEEVLEIVRLMLERQPEDRHNARHLRTMINRKLESSRGMLGHPEQDVPMSTSPVSITQKTGLVPGMTSSVSSHRLAVSSHHPPEMSHRPLSDPPLIIGHRPQYPQGPMSDVLLPRWHSMDTTGHRNVPGASSFEVPLPAGSSSPPEHQSASIGNNTWSFHGPEQKSGNAISWDLENPSRQSNSSVPSAGLYSPSPHKSYRATGSVSTNPYKISQDSTASGSIFTEKTLEANLAATGTPDGIALSTSTSPPNAQHELVIPGPRNQIFPHVQPQTSTTEQLFNSSPLTNGPAGQTALKMLNRPGLVSEAVKELPNAATKGPEATGHAPRNEFKCPHWKLSEVQRWQDSRRPLIPTGNWTVDLENRDYLFLLDNSSSMYKHWGNVLLLFESMAYVVKPYDANGVELLFTCGGPRRPRKFKKIKDLMAEAQKYKPRPPPRDPKDWEWTDMQANLGPEIEKYGEKLERAKRRPFWPKVQRKVIYVLTDGCWQPGSDIKWYIEKVVAVLDECKKDDKQFGIQFIQFGEDEEARQRLEQYDYGLNLSRYRLVGTRIVVMTALTVFQGILLILNHSLMTTRRTICGKCFWDRSTGRRTRRARTDYVTVLLADPLLRQSQATCIEPRIRHRPRRSFPPSAKPIPQDPHTNNWG